MAADSGRLGKQIVYLTNSAGGLRAAVTTSKATGKNIAGIVTYESIGYAFPLTITDPAAAAVPRPANLGTLCNLTGAGCAFGARRTTWPHREHLNAAPAALVRGMERPTPHLGQLKVRGSTEHHSG